MRSHCMKLWKWSLDCVRDPQEPKMLEMPVLWEICQRRLHTRSGTSPRENMCCSHKAERMEPSKPFDIRHGVTGFGICPDRFWFCFGIAFLHCASFPCFLDGILFCAIVCWKYVICIFVWFYRGLHLRAFILKRDFELLKLYWIKCTLH